MLDFEKMSFLSSDGKTQIAAYLMQAPEVPVKAVVQLSHGMVEYVRRYRQYAHVLAQQGYVFCGNDHLGHGNSRVEGAPYGFFADQNGYELVLNDLKRMNALAHEQFPGVPVILLGHSMGSFFARWYAERWPETIDGLMISGTAGPGAIYGLGKTLAAAIAKIKGNQYHSDFLVTMSLGAYNKKIENPSSKNAWISRDDSVVRAYDADPLCSFTFTASAYRDMLTALHHVGQQSWAEHMKKELPILLYAGDADPVGDYGKGVQAVYDRLKAAGVKDVQLKLYPDGRHEMHNELNRQEMFDDVIAWLGQRYG